MRLAAAMTVAEVAGDRLAVGGVRVQRVRVVAEGGDGRGPSAARAATVSLASVSDRAATSMWLVPA